MKLGFIGLGVMGNPMCANLVKKSGKAVLAFDINEKALAKAGENGAETAESILQVGRECHVIFTMLPRDEHVKAVYEELFTLAPGDRIYVDMSTISPAGSRETAKRAKERGEVFLDAPVVKSKQAAIAGELGIYVGGTEEVFREVEPFLACMGSSIFYLGDNGAGLVMKLCHNMLVAQIQNGVNETVTLAKKAGNIGPEEFAKAVAGGGGRNFYLESKAENLKNREYDVAFAVEYMHKDVYLAKELGVQNGFLPEGVELAAARYDEAMAKGLGKKDFSSTFELFQDGK